MRRPRPAHGTGHGRTHGLHGLRLAVELEDASPTMARGLLWQGRFANSEEDSMSRMSLTRIIASAAIVAAAFALGAPPAHAQG